jgi:SAM-dependent methyltransferase
MNSPNPPTVGVDVPKELDSTRVCPICHETPRTVAPITSSFSSGTFELGVCDRCELGLVLNPRTDFEELYGPDYYAGKGADPVIDYVGDEARGSVREIEWRGILDTVNAIATSRRRDTRPLRLLDWGAGLGGLVRMARRRGMEADGLDEGYAAQVLESKGLNVAPGDEAFERYDIVTAIEVAEHLIDPVLTLQTIARYLKPGGFLFITTGNFKKAREPLNQWYYAQIPDVHVTFWSPQSWDKALRLAGYDVSPLPLARVNARIVQYKMIKAVPKYRRPLVASLPLWSPLTRVVDSRYGVSEFPIGVKVSKSGEEGGASPTA